MGLFALTAASTAAAAAGPSAFVDGSADLEARPLVPPGLEVTVFAREPLVRQPCSMAFDARGRLFVGMGPQYRNPSPDTPGDRVVMVLDADGDGNIVEGKYPVEPTAFYIHARIHAGNPRAKVVLHTHMPYATALTSIKDGKIEMCTQNAFRYWGRIAYDDKYGGVALSNDEGERMCRAMGDKDILFLRNHEVQAHIGAHDFEKGVAQFEGLCSGTDAVPSDQRWPARTTCDSRDWRRVYSSQPAHCIVGWCHSGRP